MWHFFGRVLVMYMTPLFLPTHFMSNGLKYIVPVYIIANQGTSHSYLPKPHYTNHFNKKYMGVFTSIV